MIKTIIYAQHMDSNPLSEDGMILSEAVKATGTVMRVLKKTSCLVMSALLVFGVCGCRGGRSTGRQYEVVSDLQSVESNIDGQSSAVDSEEKQDGTSNHKTVDQEQRDGADSRPVGNEELDDWDDGVSVEIEKTFEPMVVPSRKNAYKLSNTYRKIKNGETVTVAYCGGSVSGGTGASDDTKTSWRALTTAYLRSVAAGQVKEIDA
ncbi:MAG: hypothetical protein IJT66_00150, partial [Clostridia bacterium]|nr:hypothetical protein [Clostridia bacterium]